MTNTRELGSAEFGDFTRSADLVLVDFHASWCGPCKTLAPTLDQLGAEYAGRVPVGKVNIEQAQDVAVKYGVRSVPTLMLFRDGEPVGQAVGVRSKLELQGWIEGALAQAS